MKKSKKLGSKQKKTGAIIYVWTSSDNKQSFDDQEACLREYCANRKLKVLRVFREEDVSVMAEAIRFYLKQNKAVSFVMFVNAWWMSEDSTNFDLREMEKPVIGCTWRSNDIKPLSSFDPAEEILDLMDFATALGKTTWWIWVLRGLKCLWQ